MNVPLILLSELVTKDNPFYDASLSVAIFIKVTLRLKEKLYKCQTLTVFPTSTGHPSLPHPKGLFDFAVPKL
jgi:hypothetical protein